MGYNAQPTDISNPLFTSFIHAFTIQAVEFILCIMFILSLAYPVL